MSCKCLVKVTFTNLKGPLSKTFKFGLISRRSSSSSTAPLPLSLIPATYRAVVPGLAPVAPPGPLPCPSHGDHAADLLTSQDVHYGELEQGGEDEHEAGGHPDVDGLNVGDPG